MVPFQRPVAKNGVLYEPYSQETSRCPHISGRDGPEGLRELQKMAPLGLVFVDVIW